MISISGCSVTEFAAAKINLALHVTGRRKDGYHLLDSVVTFASIGDELQLSKARGITLTLAGPFAGSLDTQAGNLVTKAANAWRAAGNRSGIGAEITLIKNLPVASGIGGGSADAAATLRGLDRLWNIQPDDRPVDEIGLRLGADVPVCLTGKSCRMLGIGEKIELIDHLPPMPAVLVNPGVPVATAAVFGELSLAQGGQGYAPLDALPAASTQGSWVEWLLQQRNDLQDAAIRCAPEIQDCLNAIDTRRGCRLARMSGSGATCFGVFETSTQAKTAALQISTVQPGWWVADTQIG